jgi:hypothetical protein
MNHTISRRCSALTFIVLLATALVGCKSSNSDTKSSDTKSSSSSMGAAPSNSSSRSSAAMAPAANLPTIRIKAGSEEPVKDAKGQMWAADTGFDGGMTIDRPDLKVTGTDIPEIYRSERYSMEHYTIKVPNGKYTLKLHFSEDFDGITDPTGRVFDYTVKDGDPATGKTIKEVKAFSPWKAAGAQYKAYVDSIPVTVTNGQISITFTAKTENPQINAIEVVPQ